MDRLEAYPKDVRNWVSYARATYGGASGHENVFVFVPAIINDRFSGIGVAILGEAGYTLGAVTELFESYDAASFYADKLNDALGYSKNTAQAVIADTMHRSAFKREQEGDTITVKLNSEQLEHAIEALDDLARGDTDVRDILQDAKDELDERLGSSATFSR